MHADDARLRATFDGSYDLVYRLMRRAGLDAGLADDGAQQAFLVLARRLEAVEEGKERAFLCSSALLIARRIRRRTARDREGVAAPEESTPAEAIVDDVSRRALVRGILSEMNAELGRVLVLAELAGYGKDEIAEALAIPAGTAASRLRRARADFVMRARRLACTQH